MTIKQFKKFKKHNYHWLVRRLKTIYGKISKKQYYFNTTGRFVKHLTSTKNPNLYRDGLFIHHIDELVYTDLSNPNGKYSQDKNRQNGSRLVYCDYLEHALLHLKIVEYKDYKNKKYYISGLLGHLIPELNDFYSHGIHAYNSGANMKLRPFYDRIANDYITYVNLIAYAIYVFYKDKLINNPDVISKSTNLPVRLDDFLYRTAGGVREDILNILRSQYRIK